MESTSDLTQGVARILRGKLGEERRTQQWFGHVIGLTQSEASKRLRGVRPLTLDQLALACEALGIKMSDVIRQAESTSGDDPAEPERRRGNG